MELIKAIQSKNYSEIKDYCSDKLKSITTNLVETKKNAYLESLKSSVNEKDYNYEEDDKDEDKDENDDKDGENKDEKDEKDEDKDD